MKIMKFGGTSVGNGRRMLLVAKIVQRYSRRESIVVVVSAMYGVTNKLISIFQDYKLERLAQAKEKLSDLYLLHVETLKELKLGKGKTEAIDKIISDLFGQLIIYLTFHKKYNSSDYDFVISFGERFSMVLLNAAFQKLKVRSKIIDSKNLIVTSDEFGNSDVFFDDTRVNAEKFLYPCIMDGIVPVVPGFYGATKDGRVATLGRGGSDYTATILAYTLDAQEVILWKEVDGVYSSDPKINGNRAKLYLELTYSKAIKMAQNGAKIIHPHALNSMASKDIVVWVKNTFKPEYAGTKIWKGKR